MKPSHLLVLVSALLGSSADSSACSKAASSTDASQLSGCERFLCPAWQVDPENPVVGIRRLGETFEVNLAASQLCKDPAPPTRVWTYPHAWSACQGSVEFVQARPAVVNSVPHSDTCYVYACAIVRCK
jgi:hypothetical protein